ncbi:MAG: Rrf2 family transcriptional regulator [Candidatus Zixiibacteriota bacterium]|nr:MAG: Rrf2 family transcriptional regulator [candidate division Zixibacteria bacterium]
MKITAIEEYGLRCMVLLARHGNEDPLTLPEFAEKEGVSAPYAGKLLMILKRSGLVKAVRGRRGGYVLVKPPEEIKLKEIFEALGKPVFSTAHCDKYTGENEICVHSGDCTVKNIWQTFEGFIGSFLERVTLADLVSCDINPPPEPGLRVRQKA